MSKRIKELRAQITEEVARAQAISFLADQEDRELTEDEQKEIDAIINDGGIVAKLEAKVDREEMIEAAKKKYVPKLDEQQEPSALKVPATPRARNTLKAFKGPDAERDAYVSGMWAKAVLARKPSAIEWCKDNGIDVRAAMSTDSNSAGGFTVPDPLETSIIRLVEEYGVFRSNIGMVWPLNNGKLNVPKRNGGFTGYYVGENTEITASDLSFAQVALQANKLGVLGKLSNELFEDTAVSLGDIIATEMAYVFAVKEDAAGFLGDGTSTYGGIVGLANALAAGAIETTATTIDTFNKLTIATFQNAMGKCAVYPGIQPKWYVSNVCWQNSMKRLALAGGGNAISDFVNGVQPTFAGYPVVVTQTLPGTSADTDHSGSIFGYFGDLGMACAMGDARGVTMATDSSIYFADDALAIRGTERYDITVHDVGTSTVAGAMVAMKFNAS